MVDLTKIRSSRDGASLRDAVADAFEEYSLELENAEKIAEIDSRVKILEAKPA